MESLVVTLDTAKKLKAAKFPQDAYFQWVETKQGPDLYDVTLLSDYPYISGIAAAPTAQEIADQLPKGLQVRRTGQNAEWLASTIDGYTDLGSTMAEALAALWLKLQEAK